MTTPTPPRFAVGDYVMVVNRAGEVVHRRRTVTWREWVEDERPARSMATGRMETRSRYWKYDVGRKNLVAETALRPIPPESEATRTAEREVVA